MTPEQCENLMKSARNREAGKPLANHTRLYDCGEYYAIRLHETDIIRVDKRERCETLDSGGWRTVTTKARINEYSSCARVYQDDGIWYIVHKVSGARFVYADGVCLAPDGNVTNHGGNDERAPQKLRRGVERYAHESTEPIRTVFRTFKDSGETIALFPDIPHTCYPGACMSYMHVGQHGAAAMPPDGTRPATDDEADALTDELERIGYVIHRRKRIPSDAMRRQREYLGLGV